MTLGRLACLIPQFPPLKPSEMRLYSLIVSPGSTPPPSPGFPYLRKGRGALERVQVVCIAAPFSKDSGGALQKERWLSVPTLPPLAQTFWPLPPTLLITLHNPQQEMKKVQEIAL